MRYRSFWRVAVSTTVSAVLASAADWPMRGGGPQRNGWARSERLLDKANVSTLTLLYKVGADNQPRGLNSLSAPIINGNLITYRGFKEMLIFGARPDKVFAVDADLNQPLWDARMEYRGDKVPAHTPSAHCLSGSAPPVLMAGNSSALMHFASEASRTPAAAGVMAQRRSPYFPPLLQTLYPLRPTTLSQLAALYTVSSDGNLHVLNSSTGKDLLPAVKFVPPNAKVTSLNIWENIMYATTGDNCDGYRNALFAIDLLSREKKVESFVPQGGGFSGTGGTAIDKDGTVYVQVMYAPGDAAESCRETVVALTPKDLKVKDYFTPDKKPIDKSSVERPGITPLVFSSFGKEMLLVGGRDGRLFLLDSKSLGGADHHTPLFASDPIVQSDKKGGQGFRGTFSSWVDFNTGTTWFYAPIFGPPHPSAKLTARKNAPNGGSIVALKLAEENGHPALQTVWLSRDIPSPAPVVIANGMVFALSTGESPSLAKRKRAPYSTAELNQVPGKATLFVLDGVTGKQLYSSGDSVSSSSKEAGLALANGRVYFVTQDKTVYCYGLLKYQSQLREQ
jgi:outer membrane protein assembly factor BamB